MIADLQTYYSFTGLQRIHTRCLQRIAKLDAQVRALTIDTAPKSVADSTDAAQLDLFGGAR